MRRFLIVGLISIGTLVGGCQIADRPKSTPTTSSPRPMRSPVDLNGINACNRVNQTNVTDITQYNTDAELEAWSNLVRGIALTGKLSKNKNIDRSASDLYETVKGDTFIPVVVHTQVISFRDVCDKEHYINLPEV